LGKVCADLYASNPGEKMNLSIELPELTNLLRQPMNSVQVRQFLGDDLYRVEREAFYGFVSSKDDGVSVMFKEAVWLIPAAEIDSQTDLYLCGFHFYREGVRGYSGYKGVLPNGVALGDPRKEIIKKMGAPLKVGGGGTAKILKNVTTPEGDMPFWIKYQVGKAEFHFTLDKEDRLEILTVFAPDIHELPKGPSIWTRFVQFFK
jgi:hypothetical protein